MKDSDLHIRKRVNFAKVVETLTFADEHSSFWPIGADVLLETYRWMISSATERGRRWSENRDWMRYPGVLDTIGHSGSGIGYTHSKAFGPRWRADLRERMLRALLRDGANLVRWRKEQGIDSAGSKVLSMLVRDHGYVPQQLDDLFALVSEGRRMRKQHNPFHPDAMRLVEIRLHVVKEGWNVVLMYGYDGSLWNGPGVTQRKGEPFTDFLDRARLELEKQITPPCDPRIHRPRRRPMCSSGWTGSIQHGAKRDEYIGGEKVVDFAAALDLKRIGYSPVLFGPIFGKTSEYGRDLEEPIEVTFDRHPWYPEKPPCYMTEGHNGPRVLTEDQVRWARARYLLVKKLYAAAFLDLSPRLRSRAACWFYRDGMNSPGSAIRERKAAIAFIDAHGGDVAWHDDFDMRCHGLRCEA